MKMNKTQKIQYTVDGYKYRVTEKNGNILLEKPEETDGFVDDLVLGRDVAECTYSYANPTFKTVEKRKLFGRGNKLSKVSFVGLIFDKDRLTVSFPKSFEYADESEKESLTALLVELMATYSDKLMELDPLYRFCVERYNELIIFKRMRDHYIQYGPLRRVTHEDNMVHGPVNWDKTVAGCIPDHIQGFPVYNRLIHQKKVGYEDDISRIEESILAGLFAKYGSLIKSSSDLTEYIPLDELGDNRYYTRVLEERRQLTYLDHELDQLDLMLDFVQKRKNDAYDTAAYDKNGEEIQLLAVSNFEILFELLIGDYYGNQIKITNKPNRSRSGIIDVFFESDISGRINMHHNDCRPYRYVSKDGVPDKLDPDDQDRTNNNRLNIIDVAFDTGASENADCVIIDAKYYSKDGLPDNESVYKQVFYQYIMEKAYNPDGKHNVKADILNVFMLPQYDKPESENRNIWPYGRVAFNFDDDRFAPIHVVRVDLRFLCNEVKNRPSPGEYTIAKRRKELIEMLKS